MLDVAPLREAAARSRTLFDPADLAASHGDVIRGTPHLYEQQ
jgi:hypothetical protein